jgi:hypothetical protein
MSTIIDSLKKLAYPIDKLRPHPDNPRLHPESQIDHYVASLLKYGQRKPVTATRDGLVIKGCALLMAARQLGWTEIAVNLTDLEGDDAVAYMLADNRTSDTSDFDNDSLGQILAGMDNPLEIPGIDLPFLETITKDMGPGGGLPEPDADHTPEPSPAPPGLTATMVIPAQA